MAAKKSKTASKGAKGSGKSWHGRLTAEADAQTAKFIASLDVDVELWPYDIVGSIAHAQMLREQNILSAGEFAR